MDGEGWHPTEVYSDHAISGASTLRAGYQKMLEDARNGGFDILVAEALDRLSRDQEDIARKKALIPMQRFCSLEEIANMTVWVASPLCSFTTGQVFDITGGRETY